MQKLSDKARQNKLEYNKQYAKKNYKRIPLDVTYEHYERIKQTAAAVNEPVNTFIKKSIDLRIDSFNEGVGDI